MAFSKGLYVIREPVGTSSKSLKKSAFSLFLIAYAYSCIVPADWAPFFIAGEGGVISSNKLH